MTARRAGDVANWFNVGLNVVLFGLSVTQHNYGTASWNLTVAFVFLAWLQVNPKIHGRLDAKLGDAVAERKMRELALALMEQQIRDGNVRVNVMGSDARVN